MARPKAQLDWDEIDKLLHIQCTAEEIAGVLGVHYDTLCNHCYEEKGMSFSEYSRQKRQNGKASLRRRQWLKATEEMNTTMLIWLGKQMLGQKDKQEVSGDSEQPITLNYSLDD